MNLVFLLIVLIAFLTAAAHQLFWVATIDTPSPMEALSQAMIESATGSVELAIGLVGVMTLFLGLMKIAEAGGMLTILSRLIRPVMTRLFPDIPADHPAMGAMILNISANALGLGNAATPFGIRAMQELNKLNTTPGTATNAMALFLAINTSSVTLLPTGVIAIRAAAGSADPAGILPTTLFATVGSTIVAILAAKIYQRFFTASAIKNDEMSTMGKEGSVNVSDDATTNLAEAAPGYPIWTSMAALAALVLFIPLTVFYGKTISPWIIPGLMTFFLIFGFVKKVRIYEVFVEGGKEGFQVALKIIPYLVAILVSVGMLRASGALDTFVQFVGRWTSVIGLPAEALPMAILRPLSGSGAYGVMASIINDPSIGPDSYVGYLVSTFQGSTETTFYVLAVYFGAVQIRRIRHTLAVALTADVAGILFAVLACYYLYG